MKKSKMKNLANYITIGRIILTFCLIFMEKYTVQFLIIYTLCGITDGLDGFVARKTHSESHKGAVLDSIADIIFLMIVCILIIPDIINKTWIGIFIAIIVIALIRAVSYIVGAVKFHRFVALHTVLNKATGVLLFLFPYSIMVVDFNFFASIICLVAGFAATEELFINVKSDEYNPDIKTYLMK